MPLLPTQSLDFLSLRQKLISAWLMVTESTATPPPLGSTPLFGARWLHYLFSTAITLVTVLMNWPPVFHLQWLGHDPHVRQHLPTTIVWNSPMRELIGSVMVSSLLLPTFGTLSLPLYFRLPSTFLPSKGRSITTLGARWHDFFFYYAF